MTQFNSVQLGLTNFIGGVNGDQVLAFTSSRALKDNGMIDRASLSSFYQADPNKTHLEVVELFVNAAQVQVPTLLNLLRARDVIEVQGADGSFTYDIRTKTPSGCYTMKDTSTEYEFPGIDGGFFEIALSQKYAPGIQLTYDRMYGQAVVVSPDFEVTQEGDYWVHTVTLASLDKNEYFDKDKLRAGIQYFISGHGLGEYSTQFATIEDFNTAGTMTCEFVLGNHRGVEVGYTQYAGMKNFMGAKTEAKEFWNEFQNDMASLKDDLGRPLDMFFVANVDKKGGIRSASTKVGSALEYLAILQNIKNEAVQLMFGRAYIQNNTNGTVRYNEGMFHQFNRGTTIEYARVITKQHISNAFDYVFQGNPIEPSKRYLKLKADYSAYNDILNILSKEFNAQLTGLQFVMGQDRAIPNPVSGSLDGLKLAPVTVTEVPLPGIGTLSVEYDPSLNFTAGSDRNSRSFGGDGSGIGGGIAVIWDASDPQYSNARTALPQGTKLIDERRGGSNIFYVKPEGEYMWWGYEQGRWSPRTAGEIMSSSRHMAQNFWVHSISAAWVRDISKYLVIKKKQK